MTEITQLLLRARNGEPHQLDKVFAILYAELHRLAASRLPDGNHTLTPTTLVHEAFLSLTASDTLVVQDRRHFFACAARSMRCIIIDHARRRSAERRGGGVDRVSLDEGIAVGTAIQSDEDLLSLDQALDHLDVIDARQRQVVELHFFAGLTFAEIGTLLECAERTAKREWVRARAFLHAELDEAALP